MRARKTTPRHDLLVAGQAGDAIVRIVKRSAAGGAGGTIEEFQIDAGRPHLGHSVKQFRDDDRGIQQANQRRTALFSAGWVNSFGVHRHIQQYAGSFALVLHQRDRSGDGGFAGVNGLLGPGATQRFRAYVQAQGPGVVCRRLDEFDDVKIFVVLVRELTDGKFGRVVGPLGGNEGVQIRAHDALNEANPAHAREVTRQVARFNVGQKVRASHAPGDGVNALGAVQHVDRLAKAPGNIGGHTLDAVLEPGLGIQIDLALPPQGAGCGQAKSGQEYGCRQGDVRAQGLPIQIRLHEVRSGEARKIVCRWIDTPLKNGMLDLEILAPRGAKATGLMPAETGSWSR